MSLTYAEVSRRVNALVTKRDREWCGIPLPLPGLTLQLEPKNPWLARLRSIEAVSTEGQAEESNGPVLVNRWYSQADRCYVSIVREQDGSVFAARHDHANGAAVRFTFNTLQAAAAWSIDAEITAVEKLQSLIKPHLWESYVMTGVFLETSARSGLTYFFRRCRPTIVINNRNDRVLCALCLHPIGYYAESFAGSMVPTDEVIAHLMLMRGDEPLYWRRANQHPLHRPEAGI